MSDRVYRELSDPPVRASHQQLVPTSFERNFRASSYAHRDYACGPILAPRAITRCPQTMSVNILI